MTGPYASPLEDAGGAAYTAGACPRDCPHVGKLEANAWRVGYFTASRAAGDVSSRISDAFIELDPDARFIPRRVRRLMRALDPCPRCGRERHTSHSE